VYLPSESAGDESDRDKRNRGAGDKYQEQDQQFPETAALVPYCDSDVITACTQVLQQHPHVVVAVAYVSTNSTTS
jgi:hypothetical protein